MPNVCIKMPETDPWIPLEPVCLFLHSRVIHLAKQIISFAEAPKTLPFAPCSLDSIRSRRHAAKRRSVEFLNRRSRQSSHRIKKQRSIDSGWRQHKERDRSHREGERRYYEKRHEQYDMNHRRIEVQKILTLNDPEEQYRKFMELVAGVKEDQVSL